MLQNGTVQSLAQTQSAAFERLVDLVCDGLQSSNSRRAYRRALREFVDWHATQGRPELVKATIQAYVNYLRGTDASSAKINQQLAAIRKLISEAEDNNLIDAPTAASARRVKGIRNEGKRLGNWMDKRQAQALLNAPNPATLKGMRDRALLAVLLGCGLRREELASLTLEQIQQREGRWVIVDLVGKRSKTRSVPMPAWAKAAVDEWAEAAGLTDGRLLRALSRGGNITHDSMTAQAVFDVVTAYAKTLGLAIAPHDLRRTFAKLARKGGADLKQIQLSLGHASVKTTEIYLGEQQSLTDAPCDRLGLTLEG